MKTTVIHHSADFDGIFCREIARKFIPNAEFIGWDYNDPKIPFPDEGMVYVLDLSPDCFIRFPSQTDRMVWIDHHKSAIDKYEGDNADFGRPPSHPIAGYRIDGVAACRLAWNWFAGGHAADGERYPLASKQDYVNRTVEPKEPYALQLAGEYDIWDKRDPNTDIFQFGLRSEKELDWPMLLSSAGGSDGNYMAILLRQGEILMRYQRDIDAGVVNHRSFMVEWEGLKFLALTTAKCNSLTFDSKDIPETGHDALMAFYYTGEFWSISMYHAKHRKDLDLSQIAVKHGGGGHRGACGFRVDKLPFFK